MSEQIREQVSAFLDGELPNSETELLLKRLTRDAELRESFGRYALIGESLRGGGSARLSQDFHTRVNRAIDGEPLTVGSSRPPGAELQRWWRPAAGAAVAAGVMAVAVLSFQQRADVPSVVASLPPITVGPVTDVSLTDVKPHEALSYTVPAAVADAPAAMPAARLTSYVFAHSKYSSVLGQSNVLSGLLTDADDQETATADQVSLPKGVHDGSP
jgi:sigma-E factor negative regulatory protein RseA